MKFLVTGDWHYRSQPPVARLDDFQAALNAKLAEIGEIARREDVTAIVVPGDVLDSPSPAYSTLTTLEMVIKNIGRPILTVPGNHDEYAHSLENLERTAYGHLAGTGLIRDLSRGMPWLAGSDVTITGAGFSATTDNDLSDYLPGLSWRYGVDLRADMANDVIVHVAHGMLLERKPGFEIKHTLLFSVAAHQECPDILICGHEHLGFGVKRIPRARGGELVAINPGALVRLSAHPGEIERQIQVCLLEIYPGTGPRCRNCEAPLLAEKAERMESNDPDFASGYAVTCPRCNSITYVPDSEYGPPELWFIGSPVIDTTLIPLKTARPGHEVLSRTHIEQAAEREAKMGKFLGLLASEGEAKFLDVQSIVEGIARSENLPRDVVNEALSRIAKARETLERRRTA